MNFLELSDMFELTWNSFPLKLNEGPSLRYGHVLQRESLHSILISRPDKDNRPTLLDRKMQKQY